MYTDILKNTLKKEKKLLSELSAIIEQSSVSKGSEKVLYDKSAFALIHQLDVLNNSISDILYGRIAKKTEVSTKEINQEIVREIKTPVYSRIKTAEGEIIVPRHEQEQFMQDLAIEKETIKKIKSRIKEIKLTKEKRDPFERATFFSSISNTIFGSLAYNLSKNHFKKLHYSLRKANMPFLLSAYLSMMFFSTFLVFLASLFIATMISLVTNADIYSFLRNILISLALPILTFISFYYYPISRISESKQSIDNELPFATVHMSAIASSGVEPFKIFQILALSEEYPAISREAKKIVNQVNIYGYDLTSALKNVASMSSSKNFSELLNGISSTIIGGGELKEYLEQKSKDLLMEYRLSREKYSTTIGMFSDIYTALLIAAPLIFMLMLVIIGSLGGNMLGVDAITLSTIGIVIIAILNILFLIFLQFTQPKT